MDIDSDYCTDIVPDEVSQSLHSRASRKRLRDAASSPTDPTSTASIPPVTLSGSRPSKKKRESKVKGKAKSTVDEPPSDSTPIPASDTPVTQPSIPSGLSESFISVPSVTQSKLVPPVDLVAPVASGSATLTDTAAASDSDESFSLVPMAFGMNLGQPGSSTEWQLTFTSDQLNSLCFDDYLAPFRGLLRSLREHTAQEQGAHISALTKGHSRKVFAAVTGHTSNQNSIQLILRTVQLILNKSAVTAVAIEGSAWAIVELKSVADVEALVDQRLVVQQTRTPKKLIVFRRIIKSSSLSRIIEVKNVRSLSELVIVKARLEERGVTVTYEDPPSSAWTATYTDRIVWKLQVPSISYQVPTAVPLLRGAIQLLPSPLCSICHSDDHHHSRCGWKEFINTSV